MRMLKKIAAGLLAAALAVGLLTACSDNKVTGTATAIRARYWEEELALGHRLYRLY